MDKAARFRWSVLMIALAATIAAIVYPVDKAVEGDTIVNTESAKPRETRVANSVEHDMAEPSLEDGETADPFAPRGWQAPPPPPAPAVTKTVAAPVLVGPPALEAPPPLPYKFMGRLDDAGVEVVYLSKGDQSLIARSGETLDGTYKIVAMDSQHIEFEHLPTNSRQTLSIPASGK